MDPETGHLTEFHLWDPAKLPAPGLVELDQMLEISLPSGAADLIDVSHRKTVGFKAFITAPLRDGEEAEFTMNYIPNSASDILLRAAKGAKRAYQIVLKNGATTWEISGDLVVRDYIRNDPQEDRRTATLRVKWVSEPTEAVGA